LNSKLFIINSKVKLIHQKFNFFFFPSSVQKLNSPTWTVDCYDEPDSERNISMLKKEGTEFFNIFSATPYKIIEKLTTEGVLGMIIIFLLLLMKQINKL